MSPDGPYTFNGVRLYRTDLTVVYKYRGDTLGTGGSSIFYDRKTHRIARIESFAGDCSIADSSRAVPTTAKLQTSGVMVRTSHYDDCGSFKDGNGFGTWSMESRGGVPMFCINFRYVGYPSNSFEAYCVEISASGRLGRRANFTLIGNGDALTPVN